MKAVVELPLAQLHITEVQTDPDPSNLRAIRCYEKVGFRGVDETVTSDGPALLMRIERAKSTEHISAAYCLARKDSNHDHAR